VLDELEQQLLSAREAGQTDAVANLLVAKAPLLIKKNDHDGAAGCYLEALGICEDRDNPVGRAQVLLRLGDLLQKEGETGLAVKRYEQALRVVADDPAASVRGGAYERLSQVAEDAGDFEAAAKWAVKIERLCVEAKDLVGLTLAVRRLARILARAGLVEDALSQYGRLFMLAEGAGDGQLQALALAAFGELKAKQGDLPAARDYLGLARKTYADMGQGDRAEAVERRLEQLDRA
ncbi:MAG: tetratricopeptide repeat protein, partial [Proteobacteria bacterium]|nr:tetratricopeptide repeat protein [Pseudomonadota bacterium]